MVGVKMYSVPKDISKTIDHLKKLSFDTVLLGGEAGINKKLIDKFKKAGISVFIVFPVFYDPVFLKENDDYFSTIRSGEKAEIDWVKFVCPSREDFLESKIEAIARTILEYNPTGITLDFIRFFVFWEMTNPDTIFDNISHGCFDLCCINSFRKKVSLPSHLKRPSEFANWILNNRRKEWTKWKNKTITSAAERLIIKAKEINPKIKTGIHVLPWLPHDYEGGIESIAGQDIHKLSAFTDFLSPMCYASICRRESEWINIVVNSHSKNSITSVIPSIQVNEAYDEGIVSNKRFEKDMKEALKFPSSGILIWSWETLLKSKMKQRILTKIL